jgi:hypothetical protein
VAILLRKHKEIKEPVLPYLIHRGPLCIDAEFPARNQRLFAFEEICTLFLDLIYQRDPHAPKRKGTFLEKSVVL